MILDPALIVTVTIALIAGVSGLWFRVERKFIDEATVREERVAEGRQFRNLIQKELSEFKLYVAQSYVQRESLKSTESRLATSLDKMGAQLEKIVVRLDKITVDMARREGSEA